VVSQATATRPSIEEPELADKLDGLKLSYRS